MMMFWQWQIKDYAVLGTFAGREERSGAHAAPDWVPFPHLNPILDRESAEVVRDLVLTYADRTARPVRLVQYGNPVEIEVYDEMSSTKIRAEQTRRDVARRMGFSDE